MGAYAYVIVDPSEYFNPPIGIFSIEEVAQNAANDFICSSVLSDFNRSERTNDYYISLHMSDNNIIDIKEFLEIYSEESSKEKAMNYFSQAISPYYGYGTVLEIYHTLVEGYRKGKVDILDRNAILMMAEKYAPNFFKVCKVKIVM